MKDIFKLIPVPTQSDYSSPSNYCKKVKKCYEMISDQITESKFIDLLIISARDFSSVMNEFVHDQGNENASLENVLNYVLKIYDKTEDEYYSEFGSAEPYPNEPMMAYATRLKSLYKKGRGQNSESLSSGEKRIIAERFLESLPSSEGSLLRIVADAAERFDVDKLAARASRCVRKRFPVASLQETTEAEAEDELDPLLNLIKSTDSLSTI